MIHDLNNGSSRHKQKDFLAVSKLWSMQFQDSYISAFQTCTRNSHTEHLEFISKLFQVISAVNKSRSSLYAQRRILLILYILFIAQPVCAIIFFLLTYILFKQLFSQQFRDYNFQDTSKLISYFILTFIVRLSCNPMRIRKKYIKIVVSQFFLRLSQDVLRIWPRPFQKLERETERQTVKEKPGLETMWINDQDQLPVVHTAETLKPWRKCQNNKQKHI